MTAQKFQIPYKITDFVPHLSEESFNLHYNVLYDNYIKQCNTTLQELDTAFVREQESTVKFLNSQLSFVSNGYLLHSLFFENLTPKRDTGFSDGLRKQWLKDFGQLGFNTAIKTAGAKIRGNAWIILSWNHYLQRLTITSHENHNIDLPVGMEPLAVFDMWEHAYYLDYHTEKGKYLDTLLRFLDKDVVSKRFDKILRQEQEQY